MITLHRSFFVLMTAAFFAPLVGMHRPTGNSNNQPERGLTQQEREELELAQALSMSASNHEDESRLLALAIARSLEPQAEPAPRTVRPTRIVPVAQNQREKRRVEVIDLTDSDDAYDQARNSLESSYEQDIARALQLSLQESQPEHRENKRARYDSQTTTTTTTTMTAPVINPVTRTTTTTSTRTSATTTTLPNTTTTTAGVNLPVNNNQAPAFFTAQGVRLAATGESYQSCPLSLENFAQGQKIILFPCHHLISHDQFDEMLAQQYQETQAQAETLLPIQHADDLEAVIAHSFETDRLNAIQASSSKVASTCPICKRSLAEQLLLVGTIPSLAQQQQAPIVMEPYRLTRDNDRSEYYLAEESRYSK